MRSAAYNARDAIEAQRTGEVFYFRHRDAPEHHEVLLPEGAATQFRDSGVLWNTAEMAEKRRDAQVAREIVVALPADAGITAEDRIELARSFASSILSLRALPCNSTSMPHTQLSQIRSPRRPSLTQIAAIRRVLWRRRVFRSPGIRPKAWKFRLAC